MSLHDGNGPAPHSTNLSQLALQHLHNASPPRTPLYQTRGTKTKPERQVARPSRPETFLDDITPIDAARDISGGDYHEGDPHDLSLSPRHVTRASIVDNMVLSLDQFSHPGNATVPRSSFFSAESDFPDSNSSRYAALRFGRRRGHTFSSSASSDPESLAEEPSRIGTSGRVISRWRNNSATIYQPDLKRIPSVRDESEPPTRTKISDSQRAIPREERLQSDRNRSSRKTSKSSTSSSLDLSQALAGSRIDPPSHRRSASFDLGQQKHIMTTFDEHKTPSVEIDAAPTPVIHAGPSRGGSSLRPPPSPGLEFGQLSISRRNSTTSSKSQPSRKVRSDTLGTAIMKNRDERSISRDAPQNLAGKSSGNPFVNSSAPSTINRTLDTTPSASQRPGFFRRVFGSSRNVSPSGAEGPATPLSPRNQSVSQGSDRTLISQNTRPASPSTKLHKQPPKDPGAPTSAGKDAPPTLSKKPSSFFRRRKKSVAEPIPVPAVLSLQPSPGDDAIKLSEPSPVSSLRQVMGPYLATPASGARVPQPVTLPQDDFEDDEDLGKPSRSLQNDATLRSRPPVPRDMAKATLAVPRDDRNYDSFLTDTSSNEGGDLTMLEQSSRQKASTTPAADHSTSTLAEDGQNNTSADLVSRVKAKPREHAKSISDDTPVTSASTRPVQDKLSVKTDQASLNQKSSSGRSKGDAAILASGGGLSESPKASASDLSSYASASSTFNLPHSASDKQLPMTHDESKASGIDTATSRQDLWNVAEKIYNHGDKSLDYQRTAAWLGEAGSEKDELRQVYMALFDWSDMNILVALRSLCSRITLKGETQQLDRMLDAFSRRWCQCNPSHGFKSVDVVHTICYSILLLNTDLHLADIDQKMTKAQFIRNTVPTIRRVAADSAPEAFDTIRAGTWPRQNITAPEPASPTARSGTLPVESRNIRSSIEIDQARRPSARPTDKLHREDSAETDIILGGSGPLVTTPFTGSARAWESTVETVLKAIYSSITKQRLPLYGASPDQMEAQESSSNLLGVTGNMLRRTPSTLSKAQSEMSRGRTSEFRTMTGRWTSKTRSRPRLYPMSSQPSARTSFDDQSSVLSPTISSTWSKASLGKTLTSMSVDSFSSEYPRGEYQKSIGFANALSQAIIREEAPFSLANEEQMQGMKSLPLLEDESLGLAGAPWAKEGMLRHKQHLDGVDKKSKDRNWNECFAVIEKGWMRLFSFSVNAKSMRQRAKDRQKITNVVGGGNWMENAEEIWKFLLRQTIASALPPPGYSKARPHVWALSLPNGAVHLFHVGTPDIVKEFVTTANYWSARLSKEPLSGGISNIEYGWSDAVVNRALIDPTISGVNTMPPPASSGLPRPSIQSSIRSSIDVQRGPRLPGDRIFISDWTPPQQSLVASQLLEVDQLRALQAYVKGVEDELQKHNELRGPMMLAYSRGKENREKAMSNWERKSSYLLREIVKFRTYCDSLAVAGQEREKIVKEREEADKALEKQRDEADVRQQEENGSVQA